MRKLLSIATAVAMAATSVAVVMPVAPAEAGCRGRSCYDGRHHYRGDRHYSRHRHYNHRRYRHRHYYDDDDNFGAAAAAGIMGLAIGAMAGAAASGGGSSYHELCAEKYRSYDPRSGTYMGYDGVRHRCRL